MEFLDFEVPVKEILEQIDKCKSIENESDVDVTKTFNLLQKKLVETKKGIYGNLSAWQKVNYPDILIDLMLLIILIIFVEIHFLNYMETEM